MRHHSTETALLRTMNAVYWAADRGEATLIVALDISAAFDTMDHTILLNRLNNSFGVGRNVLSLISSYLAMRSQTVRVGSASSAPSDCSCGVPQGSVLGPILFTAYVSPIASVACGHHVNQQQYADDTQLCIAFTKQTVVSPSTISKPVSSPFKLRLRKTGSPTTLIRHGGDPNVNNSAG